VLFEGTGNVVQESANLFWDNTNARLGIGSATPLTALSVNSLRPTISIRDTTGSTNSSYFGSFDDFLQIAVNRNPSTGVFTNTGKASAQISMEGSTSSGKIFFYATNTNGATPLEAMRINGTGNVLINTTTDAGFKLDVNGTARLNTIPIGLGGGQVATNTTVGITALSGNTSGSLNASFGYTALAFNTTGSSNTAIGFQSGYGNGTGSNNTSVGRNALITIGNYSDNTAVGAFADCVGFSGCTILGKSAVATANNQFVVGSTTTNAGAVTSEVNASTQVWNVIINGVARKILLA
jgi:hypothetical protein